MISEKRFVSITPAKEEKSTCWTWIEAESDCWSVFARSSILDGCTGKRLRPLCIVLIGLKILLGIWCIGWRYQHHSIFWDDHCCRTTDYLYIHCRWKILDRFLVFSCKTLYCNSLKENIFQPLIIGHHLSMHPIVIIVSILILWSFCSAVSVLFFASPIAASIRVFL